MKLRGKRNETGDKRDGATARGNKWSDKCVEEKRRNRKCATMKERKRISTKNIEQDKKKNTMMMNGGRTNGNGDASE